jgi:hypothetical protein
MAIPPISNPKALVALPTKVLALWKTPSPETSAFRNTGFSTTHRYLFQQAIE